MRFQILALFFVSALVSASAESVSPIVAVQDFVEGLARGLNYSDLTPSFNECNAAGSALPSALVNLIAAVQSRAPEVVADAIEVYAANVSTAIRVCGHASLTLQEFIDVIEQDILALNSDVVMQRVFAHLSLINQDYATIVAQYQNGDFSGLGETVAELVKVVLVGQTSFENTRVVRQLSEGDVVTDALDVIFVIQGFLEVANTTVNPNDFIDFVNGATFLATQIPVLVEDFKSQNISALFADGNALYNQGLVVLSNLNTLKNEVVAGLLRDLPLFEDVSRLQRVVLFLIENESVTAAHVEAIIQAAQAQDFQAVGNAAGDLYNEIYGQLVL